ncbi:AraC family transcriptional regulator [Cohnella fermenti]|uniref:Helix-turn-helix transcriptional regulator n=1 Tax=Cohnella fermenti TaxID=2565925 RepID=A0A4S4BNE7_9BACL|nr:AraC family transcriptional regulator [Cohnella fermenti]THF76391.1 helix-turn-helix transcriptional regulator [Cohnella fermenti]
MSTTSFIELKTPPVPYYWESGRSDFRVGDRHPNRRNLGLFDLLIVAGGALHIGENGAEWELRGGDTLLLLPDGEHYAVKPCEEDTVFYWIHFEHAHWQQGTHSAKADGTLPASLPFSAPYTLRLPKRSALREPEEALSLVRRMPGLTAGDSFWEDQRLFLKILSLLDAGSPAPSASPTARLAELTAAYIRQHYREELTNESLAEALHFHSTHIVRCMKARYGVTPVHYLLEYRLDRGKRLLLTTDWPVERIADEVGFRYAPYFSTCFKRRVGLSPAMFRKQYWNG